MSRQRSKPRCRLQAKEENIGNQSDWRQVMRNSKRCFVRTKKLEKRRSNYRIWRRRKKKRMKLRRRGWLLRWKMLWVGREKKKKWDECWSWRRNQRGKEWRSVGYYYRLKETGGGENRVRNWKGRRRRLRKLKKKGNYVKKKKKG